MARYKSLTLLGIVGALAALSQAQSRPPAGVDLTAESLKVHAQLTQNEHFTGAPFSELLADGTETVVLEGLQNLQGLTVPAMIQLYQKQACRADAIVVGHINGWSHHLSASRRAIYGDYDFVVEALLKDNSASSIRGKSDVVLTRPGGSLVRSNGQITFKVEQFPTLESAQTYLQFLRYIPESGAFQALDGFSTLVLKGSDWIIARKAFSNFTLPEFSRGSLETSTAEWLTACKQ